MGAVKSLELPLEYVLYDLSFTNLLLYNSTLPSYDSDDTKKPKSTGDGKNKKITGLNLQGLISNIQTI